MVEASTIEVEDFPTGGGRSLNTVAWVLQVFLALVFLLHGLLFTVGYEVMARRMRGRSRTASPLHPTFRQFIGVTEIAAAIGLIVPPAIHVLPWLAPLAAAGLAIIMAGAAVRHARRGETREVVGTVVLGLLAAATLWLRWQVVPL
jgi:uncharacterized membrane protein YphA (DoxX/SURF4 family)